MRLPAVGLAALLSAAFADDSSLVAPMADSDAFTNQNYFHEETYDIKYGLSNDFYYYVSMHVKDGDQKLAIDIVNNTGTMHLDGVVYSIAIIAHGQEPLDTAEGNTQETWLMAASPETHSFVYGWTFSTQDRTDITGMRLFAIDGTFDQCFLFKHPQHTEVIDHHPDYVGGIVHFEGTYPGRADPNECPLVTGPNYNVYSNCTGRLDDWDILVFSQQPGVRDKDFKWVLNIMASREKDDVVCNGSIYLFWWNHDHPFTALHCFGNCGGKGYCGWDEINEDTRQLKDADGNATFTTHDRWTRKYYAPECSI